MAFKIAGNRIHFKLLIPSCPLFLLCLLPLWFICLYFCFSYNLALGYFLEWFCWGSCQLLLMTNWELGKGREVGVWWERGRGGFFFSWGRVLSRIMEDQTTFLHSYVSLLPHPPISCGYPELMKETRNQQMTIKWPILNFFTQQHEVSK